MGRHEIPLKVYKKDVLAFLKREKEATIRVMAFGLHARAEKIRDAVFSLADEGRVCRVGGSLGYGKWGLSKEKEKKCAKIKKRR